MPSRAKTICSKPGCSQLVTVGSGGVCDEHRKQRHREYSRRRDDVDEQRFYNGGTWRKLRTMQLQSQPLCELCLVDGKTVVATVVHHKQEIKLDGERYGVDNLQSLCRSCHERSHAKDKFGGGR